MKKRIIIIIILRIVLIARQIYTVSNPYIKNQGWLYGDGYHLSDWIQFTNKTTLAGDIIFINNQPAATIFKRGYRAFIPNYIVIQSINTKEFGIYHEK